MLRIKVLIVDDEKLERLLIRKGFNWEDSGYEIIGEASSAKEALEFIEHRKPDLVVTDISMPQMDGLELSERILEIMPECHIVIVTGYREFEYARKAVKIGVEDFLLKPLNMNDVVQVFNKIRLKIEKEKEHLQEVEQLKKTILADKDILMESFFQRLVESRIEEEEALHKLMVYNCVDMSHQCICVNIQWIEDRRESLNKKRVENMIELIKRKEYDQSVCFIHYMKNIIIYFLDTDFSRVVELCKELHNEIKVSLGIQNSIGVSQVNTGFEGIANAYSQTLKALEATVLLGRNRVVTYSDYQSILDQVPQQKEINWDDYLFAVTNCLTDKVRDYIDEYLEQIRSSKVPEREYLWLMCLDMLTKTAATLNKYGQSILHVLDEEILYGEIRQITTISEAEAYLKKNIHTIMHCHENKKTKQGNKVVAEALEYIDENIFDPALGLKLVAAKIYTNESYLSRLFKKEQEISLIEYISKRRIEESIHLLNTTDLKVYEIAEKIGFRDPHYFSICFKKQTGITIKEFKKGINQ